MQFTTKKNLSHTKIWGGELLPISTHSDLSAWDKISCLIKKSLVPISKFDFYGFS